MKNIIFIKNAKKEEPMKKIFSREIKNLEKISKSSFWGAHWKKNLYKYICINIYQIINLKINNNTCSMLNPGIFYYDSFKYIWFFYHFTFFFARSLFRLKLPLGIIYFERILIFGDNFGVEINFEGQDNWKQSQSIFAFVLQDDIATMNVWNPYPTE